MGPQTCETRAIERSEPKTGSDVLIAIPSLNEETHIESVISVLKADSGCSEATIVVSDAGSSDQTVAIVERIGSTEAKALLADLAHGAAGARLTVEAKASLARLEQR